MVENLYFANRAPFATPYFHHDSKVIGRVFFRLIYQSHNHVSLEKSCSASNAMRIATSVHEPSFTTISKQPTSPNYMRIPEFYLIRIRRL